MYIMYLLFLLLIVEPNKANTLKTSKIELVKNATFEENGSYKKEQV